jgi:hypothetical protein
MSFLLELHPDLLPDPDVRLRTEQHERLERERPALKRGRRQPFRQSRPEKAFDRLLRDLKTDTPAPLRT